MNFKPIWIVLNGLLMLLFALYFASCQENSDKNTPLLKEHEMMLGRWFERESTTERDTSFWDFRILDLKWRSFEHYYTINGKELNVSNIIYEVRAQEKDSVILISPERKTVTLVRCKSGDSQINP